MYNSVKTSSQLERSTLGMHYAKLPTQQVDMDFHFVSASKEEKWDDEKVHFNISSLTLKIA